MTIFFHDALPTGLCYSVSLWTALICISGMTWKIKIALKSDFQVLSWESLHKDEGQEPKLKSFGGKVHTIWKEGNVIGCLGLDICQY